MPTLIFDCDGVLADTERYGHLPAFNHTFDELGIPAHWSDADYAELVKIGGGKERMGSVLTLDFVREHGLAQDEAGRTALLAKLHERKTAFYAHMVESGELPGRPGVARIVDEAAAAGWQLAVASTSAEKAVRAVLEYAVGEAAAAKFQVFAGDIVPKKKPAPDIYLLAVKTLRADPATTIVIEDSANGMRAALAAGLQTLVTTSGYTAEENFEGAALVVSSLGDPDEPLAVVDDPNSISPKGEITLADLTRLMRKA